MLVIMIVGFVLVAVLPYLSCGGGVVVGLVGVVSRVPGWGMGVWQSPGSPGGDWRRLVPPGATHLLLLISC